LVDLSEEVNSLVLVDTPLVYAADATLIQLLVDDCVCLGSALSLPGQDLVVWEFVVGEVGEKRLRPVWRRVDGEDRFREWLRSPRVRLPRAG
jgi:hypothetical protein